MAQAIVCGAGVAGLASAASLKRVGVDPAVLEPGDSVGKSRRRRYAALRLNTLGWISPRCRATAPAAAGMENGLRRPRRAACRRGRVQLNENAKVSGQPPPDALRRPAGGAQGQAARSRRAGDQAGRARALRLIRPLLERDADPDPLRMFNAWFEEARATGMELPEAVALATATPDGAPSARMVLMKGADERGIVFFTSYASREVARARREPTGGAPLPLAAARPSGPGRGLGGALLSAGDRALRAQPAAG